MSEDKRNDPNRRVDRDAHNARSRGEELASQIFQSMEDMLGGAGSLRASHVLDAWNTAHSVWQGHDIRPDADADDYPFVHLESPKAPSITGRYPINGVYLDIHHNGNAVETMHIDKEDRQNPEAVVNRFHDWVNEEYPTRDPRDW